MLAFLAHLATEFTAVLQMSDLIDRVLHGLKEEVGFESCTIGLIDERDPDTLVIVGAAGLRNDAKGLRITRGRGLSWATMEQNAPLYVPDLHADGRQVRSYENIRSGIFAPLVAQGRLIGMVAAHRTEVDGFTQVDLDVLAIVARYLGGAFEAARLHEQVRQQAVTDALTGLLTRRAFLTECERAVRRHHDTGRPFTLALLDIDGFKRLNDSLGHMRGDAVLAQVGAALRASLRTVDVVARFGGDEFVILFPETDDEQAADMLRQLGDLTVTVGPRVMPLPLSLCWGLAAYPRDGADTETLLAKVDTRLYEQKRQRGG